ncbi:MAG: four-helix bundle copper-binding protein [Sporocytophaga sp.]|uniref:four-helix bundle copper-binding protein n=1 Tax=Sporocytophaga sp. TaxID=2231183 RepID=UPI001B23B8B5|nr:four-helix bundle copper-binding protein [Sporocytophaga sp.]MBO9701463.1 four-helix bundle copper-binding protein [Sporocytophaga sp.]
MVSQDELIEILSACSIVCKKCAAACLMENNFEKYSICAKLTLDCAGITNITGELSVRGSVVLDKQLEVCIEICRLCAAECEKHPEISLCKSCAEACHECQVTCESYAHQHSL